MQYRARKFGRIALALCLVTGAGAEEAGACTPAFLDLGPESILDETAHIAVSAALIGCSEALDALGDEERSVARSLVREALARHGSEVAGNPREVRRELTAELTRRLGRPAASDVFLFGFTRLEPAKQVTLSTSRSNAGWSVIFHLVEPETVREILYRFDGRDDFRTTGCQTSVDPHSGELAPMTWTTIPDEWITPGRHWVEVKLVRLDQRVDGPFELTFDVDSEILAQAKKTLAMTRNGWISFAERDTTTYLMFTHLLSYKDALREIRYSVDDCSLSERFPFDEWHDVTRPPSITEDRPYLGLPKSTRSACVQLVFLDGSESEIFEVRRHPD